MSNSIQHIVEPDKAGSMSVKTVLAEREAKTDYGIRRRYFLTHHTAGYEIAGSGTRWTNERWSVSFMDSGVKHGRSFRTEAEARELFEKWTAKSWFEDA
jgi:hypothetical protein